jgi:D-inositol-3-phosphate glycosyltransferase
MASGLPVIALDWSGYRESVEHGRTGFLVPTHWEAMSAEQISCLSPMRSTNDTHWLLGQSVCVDLRALNEFMEVLFEDVELRRRMGNAARQRVLAYNNWPVIVRQYEELWEELISQANSQQKIRQEFKHGLCPYEYLRIFQHYATDVFNDCAFVQITPLGMQFVSHELKIKPLEQNLPPFSFQLSHIIAAACQDEQEIQISTLLKRVENEHPISPIAILQNIVRLIKWYSVADL